MEIFGIQLSRPKSGRATALGVACALALVALLYWTQWWGFQVDLTVKVLLSVSIVWVYLTSIFGVHVTDGWRQWVVYLSGLAAVSALALVALEAFALR
ncbi:hypothetical protein G3N57_04275 [Paraburkholderia sp. Se-20369]|nr:hypothetical protein [Paraburkholderia sp. Se-20369]